MTTKNYLLPPLVEPFANHFLFISTQPPRGHPAPTRSLYWTSDSEVQSGLPLHECEHAMSVPDVQSVLCVVFSETSNNRDIGFNLSRSFPRKYTLYANYTPWPTSCEVVVAMQIMASCEYTAAATQGWSAFDWAEHCLKQECRINEGDVCPRYSWRWWQIG